MSEYERIVDIIRSKLSKEDFLQLAELVDGDAYLEFSGVLSQAASEMAPELFVTPEEVDEDLRL